MDLEEMEAEFGRHEAQNAPLNHRPNSESIRNSVAIRDRRSPRERSSALTAEVTTTTKRIAAARSTKNPEFERNAKVVDLLTTSLKKRGDFFHDALRSYLFLRDARVLLPLERDELGLELLLYEYGLFPAEFVTRQVIDGLRLQAHGRGRATTVHAFTFYHRETNTVYVYDFEGGIYRICADAVEHVDNGTDGILFPQNPRWTPLRLTTIGGTVDWKSWLFEGIEFADGAAMSDSDQKRLVAVWILTLFFPQLFPTRIILALVGEKGSGKSSLLRRLGKSLFGPKFEVAMLTSKPDDFDAAVTTDPLVVADNADRAPSWFPDKLAVLATGGSVKRRLLYTTNKLGDFPVVANLAVTSRTPSFRREDVAERLLPLNVKRMRAFTPESELLYDVEVHRCETVGAILGDVKRALSELGAEAGKVHRTKFRMADFADFAMKIAPVVCTRAEMRQLLDRVSAQQVAFASEDEPLLDLIDQWLKDDSDHVNIDREIAPADLAAELERVAGSRSVPWERGNTKSFGQYLRDKKGTLSRLYGMAERSGHAGSTRVAFSRGRGGDLGALGADRINESASTGSDFLET